MSLNLFKDIKAAYGQLNPNDVQRVSERPLSVGLVAASQAGYEGLLGFLSPDAGVSSSSLGFATISRISEASGPGSHDVVLCEEGSLGPRSAFVVRMSDIRGTIDTILDGVPDLEIPLARHFTVFREPVVSRIIHRTSRENALFSVVTALPNVVPNLLELPWAVGEFATDTAFLTINQVRMAFLISAACGRNVGYGDQKMEIATIAAGAFGWRAIARELIGKIPLGGGLIPKAAVAFAGTFVVGLGLERLYRVGGKPLSQSERREAYTHALQRGKGIVQQMIPALKKRNVA